MFAAIDSGDTVSEEAHFRLIQPPVICAARAFFILQFIGLGEARTVG